MYALPAFSRSRWNFVAYQHGKAVFRSRASDLKPLLRYLRLGAEQRRGAVVYDKIVGRAAALLLSLARPQRVCTPILSRGGQQVLERSGLAYVTRRRVKFIMGYTSQALCQWEQLAKNKTAAAFLKLVKIT